MPCHAVWTGRCAFWNAGARAIDAWRLTTRGALLARIYHESDLLVAEALANGLFDGLDPAGLAAVVSACTMKSGPGAAPRAPSAEGRRPPTPRLVALGEGLRHDEKRPAWPARGCPIWVSPRWRGVGRAANDWPACSSGPSSPPATSCATPNNWSISFASWPPSPRPATAATAHRAATALQRGVVATSIGPPIAGDTASKDEPEEGPVERSDEASDEPSGGVSEEALTGPRGPDGGSRPG